MEYNFNIRIVLEGDDSEEVTESEVKEFVESELGFGDCSRTNPLVHEDYGCIISYVELD